MIRKISKEMQLEIGKALVLESAPGYSEQAQGKHYAVDTNNAGAFDAVMVLQETAAWKPWADNAYAISVWDFVEDGYDFDPTPEDGSDEAEAYDEALMFAESQIPNEWEDEPDPQSAEARYDDAFEWGNWDECLRILDEEIKPAQAAA